MRSVLAVVLLIAAAYASMPNDLYCGSRTCYDIIGVEPEADSSAIKNAYRKLARKLHPDRNKEEDAESKFQELVTAYETLKDDREDYDDYLAHPEEHMRNYYRYYRKAAPKIPFAPVALVVILVMSFLQYSSQKITYTNTIKSALDKYKQKLTEEAKQRGMWSRKASPEEKQAILTQLVLERVYLDPADWWNTLGGKCIMLPKTLYELVLWYGDRVYRLNYLKQDLNESDKHYALRRNFSLSALEYERQPSAWRQQVWEERCWLPDNAREFQKQEQARKLQERNQRAAYRRAKRYVRRHHPDIGMDWWEDQ